MKILNSQSFNQLKAHELKKVNNFLLHHHQDVIQGFTKNGRPGWMMTSGNCFFLNEKGKIKEVSIRELIERGYSERGKRGYARFSIWTISKDDMVNRLEKEDEEAAELEAEMAEFWKDKMVKRMGPPKAYSLMNSIK